MRPLFAFLLLLFIHTTHGYYGGCGGLVTVSSELSKFSKTKIDYTVVKLTLETREGTVRESTECAPNGYFFLPVYDKGSFFLSAHGPPGWNFEPSQIPVTITDDIKCGDDYNFKFTGFSLRGQIKGTDSGAKEEKGGPEGVKISLHVEGSSQALATSVSDATGSYVFPNVYPGEYTLSASHPTWPISPSKMNVKMEWNQVQQVAPAQFVVTGYGVQGTVISGEEPVPGVDFYLYSETVSKAGCSPPAIPPAGKGKGTLLCAAKSDGKGEFRFESVPAGDYTLVPVYHSAHTTYDVAPVTAPLHVGYGDAKIEAPFRVVGFGVSGMVVAGGKGVEGAKVLVNGEEKTVTSKDGTYRLEQFKAGSYDITAKKEHYVFNLLKGERVSPNSARIPDIAAREVAVCGSLSIVAPPPNVKLGVREVQVRSGARKQQTVQADKDGKYCFSLEPGTYTITPVVSPAEEKAGLNFSPSSSTVEVASEPIHDVIFSQLRVTVSGRVVCLSSPCDPSVSVTLLPTSTATPSSSSVTTTSLDIADNQFFLRNILPGSYQIAVNIPGDVWCWQSQSTTLVIDRDVTNIEFVQVGYALPVSSSHSTDLIVSHKQDKGEETHKIAAGGISKICLKKSGVYELTPKSCFKFGQDAFSFDTASPKPVELKATHMLLTGAIKSEKLSSPLQVSLSGESSPIPTVYDAQQGAYTYQFWVLPAQSVKITPELPRPSTFLSFPPSRDYTSPSHISQECLPSLPPLELRAGKFLNGKVTPSISGVHIIVRGEDDVVLATVDTSSDGSYSVGPLYDDAKFTVSAEKQDFHFQTDETGLLFKAAKLGRIRVRVEEESETKGLLGAVLLSLSGDSYRNNTATPASGELVFHDLFPGSYFLRAHLKEYTFQPPHASIEVKEGEESPVSFSATRVAFSCFGSVTGLNSLPEKGVAVVAVPPKDVRATLEETHTDQGGNFRLRGLVPSVTYTISVRSPLVDIAIPESRALLVGKEDMHKVDFVVIRRAPFIDIVGVVNTTSRSHLQTLTATLYNSQDASTPIKSIPLGCVASFIFDGIPTKGDSSEYIVRLTSSLSSRVHKISISPEEVTIDVKSVSGPRATPISFNFEAELIEEIAEVPVQGISSFMFVLIIVGCWYYREKLQPLAMQAYAQYNAYRSTGKFTSFTTPKPQREPSSGKKSDFLPAGFKSKKSKTK